MNDMRASLSEREQEGNKLRSNLIGNGRLQDKNLFKEVVTAPVPMHKI